MKENHLLTRTVKPTCKNCDSSFVYGFMSLDYGLILLVVIKVASGPVVKLASCKSALNPLGFTLLTILRRC